MKIEKRFIDKVGTGIEKNEIKHKYKKQEKILLTALIVIALLILILTFFIFKCDRLLDLNAKFKSPIVTSLIGVFQVPSQAQPPIQPPTGGGGGGGEDNGGGGGPGFVTNITSNFTKKINLVIITNPTNSNVFLDNLFVGFSPLTIRNMNDGRYHIQITHQGYYDENLEVHILSNISGDEKVVNITLKKLPLMQVAINIDQCGKYRDLLLKVIFLLWILFLILLYIYIRFYLRHKKIE